MLGTLAFDPLSLIKDRQTASGTIARQADNRNIMSSQRALARAFLDGLRIIWPVLSGLLAIIVGAGFLIGWMEGWSLWQGVYFAFVTALGIGYGDFSPTRHLTQALAILLGVTGIAMAALLAGLAVRALMSKTTTAPRN
jgi:hypothetical protein